jgi:hypothetical protein
MKKGSANVKGHKKGSANVKAKGSKGSKSAGDESPSGLEAILPALLIASRGGGAAGPQAADALPPSMGPGAAAAPAFARGTPSVQQMPNYPFGAGYMFGANEVPGQGSGRTDTMPAMLAPHEAVLNKAAADLLGPVLIAALNSQGVKQMGMGRGAWCFLKSTCSMIFSGPGTFGTAIGDVIFTGITKHAIGLLKFRGSARILF